MRALPWKLVLFALVLLMAACGRAERRNRSDLPLADQPLPPVFEGQPDLDPAGEDQDAAPTPVTDEPAPTHPRYEINLRVDYAEKIVAVEQVIIYPNQVGAILDRLPLLVPPARHRNAFQLEGVTLNGADLADEIKLEDARLVIPLDPALHPQESVEISLTYQLQLPNQQGAFGHTARQLLLADWYPFIPPYIRGQGWLINRPWGIGEYLVYPLADFHISLCLAQPDPDLVIAASAPGTPDLDQEGCYQYEAPARRNVSFAISPEYHRASAQNDRVTIEAFTFQRHAEMADRAANLALQAWETFTVIFGDNQRDYLAIIEADIDDGLEKDGLIYLSDWYYVSADPSPQNYFELLVVHETAHQWFYAHVHNDQAQDPWLDEAVATYCELLFYEQHHPDLVDWWWDFRVREFNPRGVVNSTIYDHRRFRTYVNAVYLRGADFLQALRDEMGDEAFFDFLHTYTQLGEEDFIRTTPFFFALLEQFTDADIDQISEGFFR